MSGDAKPAIIAVDIGGTNLRVALFGADGTMHHRAIARTPRSDPTALASAVAETIRLAASRGIEVDHTVAGVPGWVDYDSNAIVTLPNLPAWGDLSGTELAKEIGLPVTFANDADLATLGEHRFGAGAGCTDMAYLTCSTGVGGGVILGGQLVRGSRSAMEIGHTVIDWHTGDTVEGLGSGMALARLAGARAEEVAARATAGDGEAQRLFRRTAEAFAVGVLNMALLFAPERIVIGGGMSEAGDLLLGPIRERFEAESSPLLSTRPADIVIAERGQDAGLLGAFALWQDELAQG